MGYPTSVFSPAVRSNGQTIDAAHVNDVQSEITAVETALLGTITHSVNISGASTLASAQITNSTLANAQIANSTFSVRPVTPPPDAAKVVLGSSYTLGSSAASTLVWTSQEILTNSSMHSTTTNPERLTPQSTGLYMVAAQIAINSTEAGQRSVAIKDSSANNVCAQSVAASSRSNAVQVSGLKRFDVLGGYVICDVGGIGQSTMSVSAGGANWFFLLKL